MKERGAFYDEAMFDVEETAGWVKAAGFPGLAISPCAWIRTAIMKIRAIIFLLLFLPVESVAATVCTQRDALAAEMATDNLSSWNKVYRFYKKYGHCFDASIAEGATDKIDRLLMDQWQTLPQMIQLTRKDPTFKEFIWQRIHDDIFPMEWFDVVVEKSRNECPMEGKEFCQAVIRESTRRSHPDIPNDKHHPDEVQRNPG